MHSRKYLLTALALALPLVWAVDLRLYYDLADDYCDDDSAYAQCSDINADVCCVYGYIFFSILGTGLDTTGVPDVAAAFTGSQSCSVNCNSGGGNSQECVSCDNTELGGANWYVFGSKRSAGAVSETVQPDRIGLFDTELGTHRLYRIGAGVPSSIIAELDAALVNNTRAEHLSSAVLPYEIQQ